MQALFPPKKSFLQSLTARTQLTFFFLFPEMTVTESGIKPQIMPEALMALLGIILSLMLSEHSLSDSILIRASVIPLPHSFSIISDETGITGEPPSGSLIRFPLSQRAENETVRPFHEAETVTDLLSLTLQMILAAIYSAPMLRAHIREKDP